MFINNYALVQEHGGLCICCVGSYSNLGAVSQQEPGWLDGPSGLQPLHAPAFPGGRTAACLTACTAAAIAVPEPMACCELAARGGQCLLRR